MGADVGGTSSPKSEPNVVPLCDVLLVLLIIFMVVTPMIKSGLNVALPEARATKNMPEPGKLITIFIQKDGVVAVDDKKVELAKLPDYIIDQLEERKQTEKKILLKVDNEVKYGLLSDVMTAIRDAQIELVGLITKAKTSEAK